MEHTRNVLEAFVEVMTYAAFGLVIFWGLWHSIKLYLQWRSEQQRMISRGPDKRTNRAMQDWSDKC